MQSEFNSLRSVLESGVPTVRNKKSAHGQGSKKTVVPAYFAGYCLNVTAANIILLIKLNENF